MYDHKKFKALVHYVCSRRSDNPSTLGAVKLNKILWYSDLSAYYRLGHPITGARYVKRQFGAVPKPILPVLDELEGEGVLTVKHVQHFGKQKKEYIVHQNATGDFLPPEELQIVDQMIEIICDQHTAESISAASHDHIWKAAEDGEDIPLFTVFAQTGQITDEDREWARMQLEHEGL